MSLFAWLKAEFAAFENDVEKETLLYAEPAITFIAANGGKIALTLAESVLSAFTSGTPWATIVSEFTTQAASAGITLAEGAGEAILNYAQSNMIAQGIATGASAVTAASVTAAS